MKTGSQLSSAAATLRTFGKRVKCDCDSINRLLSRSIDRDTWSAGSHAPVWKLNGASAIIGASIATEKSAPTAANDSERFAARRDGATEAWPCKPCTRRSRAEGTYRICIMVAKS